MSRALVVWTGTQQEFYDWSAKNWFNAAGDKALDDLGRTAHNVTQSHGSIWVRLRSLRGTLAPTELVCYGSWDEAPDRDATMYALAALGLEPARRPSPEEIMRAGTALVDMAHALAEASRVAPNES